jgi:hypothetical protein
MVAGSTGHLGNVGSMPNPYRDLPNYAFWNRAVAGLPSGEVDPVGDPPFLISKADKIATAGSCFAQHISRSLGEEGFHYYVTERTPLTSGAADENYGAFSARFGNIYTTRQLLQLFQRAYGLFHPVENVWTCDDGSYVDPFRPQIQKNGFASVAALENDRQAHLLAVREMFENCNVFIFTLGLTEAWISSIDGAAFAIAPGVVGTGTGRHTFENLSVEGMIADLSAFVAKLRVVNRDVRIVLTVSPVSLVATYEAQHVLLSTTYSKAALRVVAEAVSRAFQSVSYFPSYEIIVGAHARNGYFAEDLRSVTPEGVAHVMRLFKRHYLVDTIDEGAIRWNPQAAVDQDQMERDFQIVCDEEALDA